jgi:putative addiction module component (TIGR02574 family)
VKLELLEAAKALPLAERVEFAEAVWESIADEAHKLSLTAAQAAELDHRLEAHKRSPADAIPWTEVKSDLERRYGRKE